MGKRAEDLPLDDTPIDRSGEPADDRDQAWYQFTATIDDLLATGEYSWAWESLTGIKETVEKTRRVSDGQRRAVGNIEASGERREGRRRRYDGWPTRGRW